VTTCESELPAKALVFDRELIRHVYALRTAHGNPAHDEVWDGTLVLFPIPDLEHRALALSFALASRSCETSAVFAGVNVSDRESGWTENYRCPDVAAYLVTNPARDANTHWIGGPDLAVEIVSPGEDPRLKLDFYAKVNTRELLIVDRYPWALELYRLAGGKMELVGTATGANGAVLTSGALPLSFAVKAAAKRPAVHITHTATGQTWVA
jgi:Uma2 family endonuclease